MTRISLYSAILLVLTVTDVRAQFFDFFSFQPLVQQFQTAKPRAQYETTEATTKRHDTRKHNRKTNTVLYNFESSEKRNEKEDSNIRKSTIGVLNLSFDSHGTTSKPVKTTRRSVTRTSHKNSNRNIYENDHTRNSISKSENSNVKVTTKRPHVTTKRNREKQSPERKDKPISSNIADDYYNYTKKYHAETVTKSVHTYYEDNESKEENHNRNHFGNNQKNFYTVTEDNRNSEDDANTRTGNRNSETNNFYFSSDNNNDYNNNQRYTTKNPYNIYDYNNNQRYTTNNPLHRPGVKPPVSDNRPPITNRPITHRPMTHRPVNNRQTTKQPIAVFPRPTDAGSIAFPEDEDGPEIITGPDEDYMSETDKRRYIEVAERMCDKYKSLNMKQLQAIPLIPSPEPVEVNISSCAPTTVPLVVGGKVVTINEFPHMALLGWVKIDNGGYSWKCGGSLISDQYVLTAAHCAYQERDNTVVIGAPRVVQLGSSYLDDPGALVVRISAVIRHPKYKNPKSYYDLALVKLVRPVTFSEVIRPACLGVPPSAGEPIIATGWGQTRFGGDQSLELRSVSLPVWNMGSCANVLGTSRKLPNGPMSDSQMCAGDTRGGKDTCQGDSGGPAQLQEGCAWRVVAVTSLGRSCGAPNTPGLYATVQRAFIAAQVFGQSNGNNNNNRNNNRPSNNNKPSNNRQNGDFNRNGNEQSHRLSSNNRNNNDDSNRGVDYHYEAINNQERQDGRNSYENGNQNYNSRYTTEHIVRINDYYNSFSNNQDGNNNNNRYNRQGTKEYSNRENNDGNDYNFNSGFVMAQQNNKRNNESRDIQHNYEASNSKNYYTSHNPRYLDSYNGQQSSDTHQNYDSSLRQSGDRNMNQDSFNNDERPQNGSRHFDGPTWWTRR